MNTERAEAEVDAGRRALWAGALVGYSILLTGGSLVPVGAQSPLAATASGRALSDLLHVPAYMLLTGLWVAALRARGRGMWAALAFGAAAAVAFGALMELAQCFVPARGGSVADLGRNALGAGLACAALLVVGMFRRRLWETRQ